MELELLLLLASRWHTNSTKYKILGQSMQWLLSNLNPMLSSKPYPKMAMAKSHAKKSNSNAKIFQLPIYHLSKNVRISFLTLASASDDAKCLHSSLIMDSPLLINRAPTVSIYKLFTSVYRVYCI